MKALIERNYNRARQLLTDNMDILHAMKDALMKYETIDAPQIDDLMARRDVRPPAGWEEPGASNDSGDNGSPKAPRPVDEPRTPNPGNTMSGIGGGGLGRFDDCICTENPGACSEICLSIHTRDNIGVKLFAQVTDWTLAILT